MQSNSHKTMDSSSREQRFKHRGFRNNFEGGFAGQIRDDCQEAQDSNPAEENAPRSADGDGAGSARRRSWLVQ